MSAASRAPVAVLGLGGVGGLVAARTGAICVGTERSVAAIRSNGLTLVHGGDDDDRPHRRRSSASSDRLRSS